QLLRVVAGVFVGIYIARYLGPADYGLFSYSLAIAAFLMAIAKFGMDAILVRELVQRRAQERELLGTAFWMMAMAAALSYAVTVVVLLVSGEERQTTIYIVLVAGSIFFSPFLTID